MRKQDGEYERRIAALLNQVDFGAKAGMSDVNEDANIEPGPHPWVPEYREEEIDSDTVEKIHDDDRRIRMIIAKNVINGIVELANEPFHSQLIYEIEAIVNELCTNKELGHDIERVLSVDYDVQNKVGSPVIDYRCDLKLNGDIYEVDMLKDEVATLLVYTDNYTIQSMTSDVIDLTDMDRFPNMYILRLEGEAVVNY